MSKTIKLEILRGTLGSVVSLNDIVIAGTPAGVLTVTRTMTVNKTRLERALSTAGYTLTKRRKDEETN